MITKRRSLSQEEKEKIISKIKECLQPRHEISFAYLHGSFAGSKTFADVDIAIYLDPDTAGHLDYEVSLEGLLEKVAGVPFDVRVINNAPPSFCYNVLRKGYPILVRDQNARCDFQARTLDMYFDFAPFRSRYLKEALRHEM